MPVSARALVPVLGRSSFPKMGIGFMRATSDHRGERRGRLQLPQSLPLDPILGDNHHSSCRESDDALPSTAASGVIGFSYGSVCYTARIKAGLRQHGFWDLNQGLEGKRHWYEEEGQ